MSEAGEPALYLARTPRIDGGTPTFVASVDDAVTSVVATGRLPLDHPRAGPVEGAAWLPSCRAGGRRASRLAGAAPPVAGGLTRGGRAVVACARGEPHDDGVARESRARCRPGRRRRRLVSAGVLAAVLACLRGRSAGDEQPQRRRTGRSPSTPASATSRSSRSSTAFEARDDGGQVDLFRAPTGELNARVAADARSGGLRADVIWGCDPLTVQAFVDQDLVGGWTPRRRGRDPGASSAPTTTSAPTCSTWWRCTAPTSRPRRPGPTWPAATTTALAVPDPDASPPPRSARWAGSPPSRGYGVDFYRRPEGATAPSR